MKNTVKLGFFALVMVVGTGSLVAMERIPTGAELEKQKAQLRTQLDTLNEGLKIHAENPAQIQTFHASALAIAQQAGVHHPDLAKRARDIARAAEGILHPRMQATGPGAGPARQLFPPASPTTAAAAAAATMPTPTAPAPAPTPPATPMDLD